MEAGLADPYQGPSNLRLKGDDSNNGNGNQETLVEISNPCQLEASDDRIKDQTANKQDEYDPPEKSFSSRTLKKTKNDVNEDAY